MSIEQEIEPLLTEEANSPGSVLKTHFLSEGQIVAERYEVKSLLGSGGMANVYLAFDKLEGRDVALKVLHQKLACDKSYVERFLREARLMIQISSPVIVKAYDVGTCGAIVYLTMEFVPGDSLDKILDCCRLSVLESVYVLGEICQGLKVIHDEGIIYRDLKPSNILVTRNGEVKLTDFGVAREPGSKLTGTLQKLGSVCYIAPEVWLGKRIWSALDMYALGVVLYEMLTGDVPFEGNYPGEVMEQHLKKEITPPRQLVPSLPEWLNIFSLHLLSKSPKSRPSASQIGERCALALRSVPEPHKARTSLGSRVGKHPKSFLHNNPLNSSSSGVSATSTRSSQRQEKTYIFRLSATQIMEQQHGAPAGKRRSATVYLPLPRHSAVVFEFEIPSRDFIYLGIFLASLQVFDGVLTAQGMSRFTTEAEGNLLLKTLMNEYGVHNALLLTKGTAILLVLTITIMARKIRWIRNVIAFLSVFYLLAAIIPWLFILHIN